MPTRHTFPSRAEANDFRDEYGEHTTDALDRRHKTVELRDDAPEHVVQRAEELTAADAAEGIETAMAKLSQDERDRLEARPGWTWQQHGAGAMWAKGTLQKLGATEWLDFYEAGEGWPGAVKNLETSRQRAAETGAQVGADPDRDPAELTAGRAEQLESAHGQACDHASGACELGDPDACEYLRDVCGYTRDEVAALMRADGTDELTGAELGMLKRSWGGYLGAVEGMRRALEALDREHELAHQAFAAINAVRREHGQDELTPLKLDQLEDMLREGEDLGELVLHVTDQEDQVAELVDPSPMDLERFRESEDPMARLQDVAPEEAGIHPAELVGTGLDPEDLPGGIVYGVHQQTERERNIWTGLDLAGDEDADAAFAAAEQQRARGDLGDPADRAATEARAEAIRRAERDRRDAEVERLPYVAPDEVDETAGHPYPDEVSDWRLVDVREVNGEQVPKYEFGGHTMTPAPSSGGSFNPDGPWYLIIKGPTYRKTAPDGLTFQEAVDEVMLRARAFRELPGQDWRNKSREQLRDAMEQREPFVRQTTDEPRDLDRDALPMGPNGWALDFVEGTRAIWRSNDGSGPLAASVEYNHRDEFWTALRAHEGWADGVEDLARGVSFNEALEAAVEHMRNIDGYALPSDLPLDPPQLDQLEVDGVEDHRDRLEAALNGPEFSRLGLDLDPDPSLECWGDEGEVPIASAPGQYGYAATTVELSLSDMRTLQEYLGLGMAAHLRETDTTPGEWWRQVSDERVADMSDALASCSGEVPVPWVEFGMDGTLKASQEGRHRTLAAQAAGMDRVPLRVVFNDESTGFGAPELAPLVEYENVQGGTEVVHPVVARAVGSGARSGAATTVAHVVERATLEDGTDWIRRQLVHHDFAPDEASIIAREAAKLRGVSRRLTTEPDPLAEQADQGASFVDDRPQQAKLGTEDATQHREARQDVERASTFGVDDRSTARRGPETRETETVQRLLGDPDDEPDNQLQRELRDLQTDED